MSMTKKQKEKFIEKAEKAPVYIAGRLRQLLKERQEMLFDIIRLQRV